MKFEEEDRMRLKRIRLWGVVLWGISCLLSSSSWGQEQFPTKPVTLVNAFGSGGGHDIFCRMLSSVAPDYLGQPLVVVMKAGASGIIGTQYVARSKPDGYTLLAAGTSNGSIVPQLEDTGYTKDSFVPVAKITHFPYFVAVGAEKPWKTLEDLLNYIRKNPEKARFGTNTAKGVSGLANRKLLISAGISTSPPTIAFKGVSEVVLAAMKGDVDYLIQPEIALLPYIESKGLRVLATLEEKGRLQTLPDVPSAKELGYDVVGTTWVTILAPHGTPENIVEKLSTAFANMVKAPSFVEMVNKIKMPVYYEDRVKFQKSWDDEYKKFGDLIDQLGWKKK